MVNFEQIELSDLRYERKFVIDGQYKAHVESLIKQHPAIFSEAFPTRPINNMYFDSMDKSSYLSSQIGITERVKFRIRWYGNLFGYVRIPILECKTKRSTLVAKPKYPLRPFFLSRGFSSRLLREVFNKSDLPEFIRERLALMEPVLVNRYMRRYYVTADRKYRLTLDYEMEFYEITPVHNIFCRKTKNGNDIILELKYAEAEDILADDIMKFFPFRLTRNSKYVNGMDMVSLS